MNEGSEEYDLIFLVCGKGNVIHAYHYEEEAHKRIRDKKIKGGYIQIVPVDEPLEYPNSPRVAPTSPYYMYQPTSSPKHKAGK